MNTREGAPAVLQGRELQEAAPDLFQKQVAQTSLLVADFTTTITGRPLENPGVYLFGQYGVVFELCNKSFSETSTQVYGETRR
jgi:hypothetical protein